MPKLTELLHIGGGRGDWYKVDVVQEFSRVVPIEYARAQTLVQAREDALHQAMPEGMTLDELICDLYGCGNFSPNAARSMFSLISLAGYIVEERVQHADVESFEPDHYTYRVRMRARIQPNIGKRDPGLQLHMEVNRQHLMAGEELEVTARATKDGHLYLFYFLFDQSVMMIYPIRSFGDSVILADTTVRIPSQQEQARGLRYIMMPDPNTDVTYETLYGVFCTQQLDLTNEIFLNPAQQGYNRMGMDNFSKFQRLLASVPVQQRVEQAIQIEIQQLEQTSHFF